ncbi:MAG: S8 family serine peptidase, partial [Chlorobi bacterium]|nr:S8 family serine peptidase [Chlorobiota bacterium]
MKHLVTVMIFFVWSAMAAGQVQSGPDVAPGIVVVKVTAAVAERGGPAYDEEVSSMLHELGVFEMESMLVERWSVSRSPELFRKTGNLTEIIRKEKEVARIFQFQYTARVSPVEAAAKFSALRGVEYAEPLYLCYPTGMMFAPNDSLFSKQAFLQTIHAEEAWDITKGDSTIVIGVGDTGIDWSHPDLEPNIWINPGEWGSNGELSNNGKDDDGNGLVDDWHGWDFAGADNQTPDNDTRGGGSHGTKVAGLVAAATNNRIGIASIGYKCKILPMKIGPDGGGGLRFGYQAMQYAVFMGCKVFNASWGTLNYSKAAEDVVNLVTTRGMLVVGGGGNHGKPTPFYPAAFSAALGVGMTNANDIISGASGYGPPIDVMSPGSGALSTSVNGQYGTFGGTSAASPIVSGLAGLVISRFPSFSPMQVRQRIRVTADNIDDKNPKKAKFAGYGRINAFRAVGTEKLPAVRIENVTFVDPGNDGQFYPGEKVEVMVALKNYLSATPGPVELTLEAATGSSAVTIGTATTTVPAIAPNAVRAATTPMTFTVEASQQYDREVIFRVLMKSGSYEDHDFFTVSVNPSYQTLANGKLALTIPADGSLGHPDYPANKLGVGLRYDGSDLYLWMGALMIGTDSR